ncbi:MAG: hypothetical protein JKX85_15650 [Phycisphaeraceae bacterium]|nr:hypothetical protein [Phycisphaeraceae bacterium]
MSIGYDKLAAVNKLLGIVNESPVATLDTEGSDDAANAERILDRVSAVVQGEGWHANRETNVPLTPNVSSQIDLPDDYARIDSDGVSKSINVARRGKLLYNITDHTLTFTSTVYCTVIKCLSFDDLTPLLKRYIVAMAAIEFQREAYGSRQVDAELREEAQMARIEALHEDAENEDSSLLDAADMRYIMGDRNTGN